MPVHFDLLLLVQSSRVERLALYSLQRHKSSEVERRKHSMTRVHYSIEDRIGSDLMLSGQIRTSVAAGMLRTTNRRQIILAARV